MYQHLRKIYWKRRIHALSSVVYSDWLFQERGWNDLRAFNRFREALFKLNIIE